MGAAPRTKPGVNEGSDVLTKPLLIWARTPRTMVAEVVLLQSVVASVVSPAVCAFTLASSNDLLGAE